MLIVLLVTDFTACQSQALSKKLDQFPFFNLSVIDTFSLQLVLNKLQVLKKAA